MHLLKEILFGLPRLRAIDWVIAHVGRGVDARISDNRQLLALLEMQCSEFLARNPSVRDWIKAQDHFLNALARAARTPAPSAPTEGSPSQRATTDPSSR